MPNSLLATKILKPSVVYTKGASKFTAIELQQRGHIQKLFDTVIPVGHPNSLDQKVKSWLRKKQR